MKASKRLLNLILCCVMLVGYIPAPTFAQEATQSGLCEHHPEHSDCGYAEGEASCGFVCELCSQEQEETPAVCNGLSNCSAENHNDGCEKKAADKKATADQTAPAHSHTEVVDEAVAPTCTKTGLTEGSHCSVCDEVIKKQVTIPATGHHWQVVHYSVMCSYCGHGGSYEDLVFTGSCGENVTWEFSGGVMTISGTGAMTTAPWRQGFMPGALTQVQENIPPIRQVIIEDGVTGIWEMAFEECKNLTSITIPDSVSHIGMYAFWRCDGLTSVTIPASITSMDGCVFELCSNLTSVTIYGDIGYATFRGCPSLAEVTIGDSVTDIDDEVFRGCTSLTSITLPDSVTSIGDYAFAECTGLKRITFEGDAPAFDHNVFNGVTAIADYPAGNLTWTSDIMQNYGGTITWIPYSNGYSPLITQQPESVEQEVGKQFSITVKAEGDGLTYQWYYKDGSGKAFAPSSNKTSAYAYTMQNYMHNRQVYCVITDQHGNDVTTETATITRPPIELKILEQPKDSCVEIGEPVGIQVKVQGDGLTYQWYYKDSNMKEFVPSALKSSRYAIKLASYCHNRQVYCVITDRYGKTVTTNTVTMTRPPMELKILSQPADVSASVGTKFSISFEVQGNGLTYQWYVKESGAKAFKVSSNKTAAYAYATQRYMNNRQVYCIITDQYGNQVTTNTVTIHVTN